MARGSVWRAHITFHVSSSCEEYAEAIRIKARVFEESGDVNTTPHTSHFLTELHAHAWLKLRVCRAHMMCHPRVFVLTLFDCSTLPLSADHLLSYHPVHPLAHQLHLPGCGGQIPCALPPMRTLAPLPSTTLSTSYEPNDYHITEATEPYIQESSSENGSLNDLEYDDATIGNAFSSPLFTQEREDDASRRRAFHSHDEGLLSSRSSSVRHRTGRPVVEQFDSQIPNVRETLRHSSESEQIRIQLEREREEILADCHAEIRKHEFQADYDRRSIQKLNEMVDSQRGETYRAHQGDERLRQDQQLLHEQLLKQNWDLREAHEKSLSEMEELKRYQGSTFDTISRRKLVEDRDTILELTGKIQKLQIEIN